MNPIGQFIPGHSFLHHLDPRTKIFFVFVVMILIFTSNHYLSYTWILLFILIGIWTANVSLLYTLKISKQIWMIILLTAFLHLWLTQGGEVILQFSIITIYEEGLKKAVFVSFRFVLLVLTASLLTFTTSTIDLIDGIEAILKPFTRFGFPAHEFALMMSITLRFIPLLWEEMEKVKKAQLARGSKLDQGWIWERLKYLIPLFVPLFLSILRRSDELAQAMESRCYRGDQNRTKFRQLSFSHADGMALGVMLILILGFLGIQRVGSI